MTGPYISGFDQNRARPILVATFKVSTSSKAKWAARPALSVLLRYGLAIASVAAAIGITLILRHYGSPPRFISHFILIAIAITFWCAGTGPGLLALLLSCFALTLLAKSDLLLPGFPLASVVIFCAVFSLLMGWFSAAHRKVQRLLSDSLNNLELRVTERTAELTQASEELQTAQAALAHVTRVTTLGEMTASIAHEVNQPLGSIINNANTCLDLLPNGPPQLEEVRDALVEIIEGAERASAVISRVRQLSRKVPCERIPLNLRDVVTDTLALARHEAATRQVTIRTNLTDDLPPVLGDRVQLQQVLLNLVVNGMDAMSTIEVSKRILLIFGRCEAREGKPGCVFGVRDAGTGIKAGEMDRLFEAFYTTKPQGMGMGLAISRSIIEAHGGTLWAEPNQGPGATFLFSLPAAPERFGEGGPDARKTKL